MEIQETEMQAAKPARKSLRTNLYSRVNVSLATMDRIVGGIAALTVATLAVAFVMR